MWKCSHSQDIPFGKAATRHFSTFSMMIPRGKEQFIWLSWPTHQFCQPRGVFSSRLSCILFRPPMKLTPYLILNPTSQLLYMIKDDFEHMTRKFKCQCNLELTECTQWIRKNKLWRLMAVYIARSVCRDSWHSKNKRCQNCKKNIFSTSSMRLPSVRMSWRSWRRLWGQLRRIAHWIWRKNNKMRVWWSWKKKNSRTSRCCRA